MRKPADIVAKGARPKVPVFRRPHYRYNTAKILKTRRAKRGSGRIVATYLPGNLAKSIRRLPLRKTSRTWVGPKKAKRGRASGVFGRGRFDGYYAIFLKGSNAGFRRAYLEPSLTANSAKALAAAERALAKELAKIKTRTRL